MVVHQLGVADELGPKTGADIIPTIVLQNHYMQVAEGIGHRYSGVTHGEVNLLVQVASFHVARWHHAGIDLYPVLENHEPAGKHQIVLVRAPVDFEQVVARHGGAHELVREFHFVFQKGL